MYSVRVDQMHLALEPLHPTHAGSADIVAQISAGAPNAVAIREILAQVVEGQLSLYDRTEAADPWIGYLARDPATQELVGSCSFIGKPSDGSVEIAYFTFPPYESRGVATAMAGGLLQIAASAGNPKLHAFTLPEENASTRILRKHGFAMTGKAQDEDAGEVWRWERLPA